MKIILTENKFIGVIQKLIDYHLKNLQELEESGAECPNDISDSVWGDFQSIDEIKVVDLQQTNFTITDMQVFIVTVNVVYNSVGGINIDEIIYNLEYLCKNTSGLRLNFSVNESINKHRENGIGSMKFLIKENKLTETIFRYLDTKKFYFEETQYEIFLSDDIISDEDPDLQIYSIIFDKIDSTCHINTDLIHEVLNFFSLDFKMSRKMITEWFISRYNKKVLGHSTI